MHNPVCKSNKSTMLIKALLNSCSYENYVALLYDYTVNVRMQSDVTSISTLLIGR